MSKAMSRLGRKYGWVRDSETVASTHQQYVAPHLHSSAALPDTVVLRDQFPPAYEQGKLGSCTANAIAGAIEFQYMKEGLNPAFVPSRLFLYYNERSMEGTVNFDQGAQLIDGMKSVSTKGDCPETMWPYDITKYAVKPPANCYSNAMQYKVTSYQAVRQTLDQMQGCLASGYPFVFGIQVYSSFESDEVAQTGMVPMPSSSDTHLGGHAVVAVGYNNSSQCFIMRNSWGVSWGVQGYGMLPYQYLLDTSLSSSFWTIRSTSGVVSSVSNNSSDTSVSPVNDSSAVTVSTDPFNLTSNAASLPLNQKSFREQQKSSSFVERLEEERKSSAQEAGCGVPSSMCTIL